MTRKRRTQGFSLIELLVVIAIVLIMTASALFQIAPALKNAKAESALQTALGQIRRAHGLAIDQRRTYRVSFISPRTIQLDQVAFDSSGNRTFVFVSTIDLPLETQFTAILGIPVSGSRTPPDGLGTGANAIDFSVDYGGGGGTQVFFSPDGRALDFASRPNSGVVYLARPGDLMSSRAVSVLSATGRIKAWRLIQSGSAKVWSPW